MGPQLLDSFGWRVLNVGPATLDPLVQLLLGLLGGCWILLAVQSQAAAIPGSPSAERLLVDVPIPSSPLALVHIQIWGSEAVWGCQEQS